MAAVLDAALAYLRGGISVIPIARDGTKRPCTKWAQYQQKRLDPEEAARWWNVPSPPGIAAIGGQISGHLECLDFDLDAEANFAAWEALVSTEAPDLLHTLPQVMTPTSGRHVWYRCAEPVSGNLKLAWDETGKEITIETRGEGGYALVPGCPADCHEARRLYRRIGGPPLSEVPTIGVVQRELLLRCARSLCKKPVAQTSAPSGLDLKPGDDFDVRGPDWGEILAGWTLAREDLGVRYWRRPGKDAEGWSATTGRCRGSRGEELLRVFSSNASPFEEGRAYGKFRALALLGHNGDLSVCAKDLARQGYGRPGAKPSSNEQDQARPPKAAPGSREASHAQEIEIPEPPPWPAQPFGSAFDNLAGEIVRTIEPQTEADPVAILAQVLVMFGSAIGRKAHWKVENDRHYGNLFLCLVGETSSGRKGTSKGRALQAFANLDDDWARHRITSGLSSGEGLIQAVRDEVWQKQPIKKKGEVTDYQSVMIDEGVEDKRLLVVEPEFGRVLKVMEREGNTLSARLREAWESGDLSNLTKGGLRSTGAHISIIAHVTPMELLRLLADVDRANGLANRFLWIACRRSKFLPLGGDEVDLGVQAHKLALAVEEARKRGEVGFDTEARDWWASELYATLTSNRTGVVGAVTDRAAAQVRRMAMLHALMEFSPVVCRRHLLSALALWDYSENSVRWVFGESTGNRVADEILDALRSAGERGMTQSEIRGVFHRHESGQVLGQALATLRAAGKARCETTPTEGRPVTRWFFLSPGGAP